MNVFDVSMKQIRNGLVYLPNETKPFTGGFVGWYPNGQKKEEVNYIDGLAVGTRTVWIEQYYKDGKLDGKYTRWDLNGTKAEESNYKDGKEDGQRLTWWYRNGKKESETNYKDGKKDGNSILWFKNGQKRKESNYIDGKKTSFIVMRLKKIGINPKK